MDDKQQYFFQRIKQDESSKSNVEHFFVCNGDDPWPIVMLQFATFLDTSGYVGVYEAVDIMLEEREASRWGGDDDHLDLFDDEDEGQ